jgi:hypothetical protein
VVGGLTARFSWKMERQGKRRCSMPVIVTHVCDVCGKRQDRSVSRMRPMRMVFDDQHQEFRVDLMCEECWTALHTAAQEAIGERKTQGVTQAPGD